MLSAGDYANGSDPIMMEKLGNLDLKFCIWVNISINSIFRVFI